MTQEQQLQMQHLMEDYSSTVALIKMLHAGLDRENARRETVSDALRKLHATTLELFDGYKLDAPFKTHVGSMRGGKKRVLPEGFVFGVNNLALDDDGRPIICCSFQERTKNGRYVVRTFEISYYALQGLAHPISDRKARLSCAIFGGYADFA